MALTQSRAAQIIAVLQPVILNERPFLPGMKDLDRRSHPLPPPWVIPDWRRLQRGHPISSQIGVDFREHTSIGVRLSIPLCSFVTFVVSLRSLLWLNAERRLLNAKFSNI